MLETEKWHRQTCSHNRIFSNYWAWPHHTHPTSSRSILILSAQLCSGLSRGVTFLLAFPSKIHICIPLIHILTACLTQHIFLDYHNSNYTSWRPQVMTLLIRQPSSTSCPFFSSQSKYSWHTPSVYVCFSCNVRDKFHTHIEPKVKL
jgi:hypothetical protein